MRDGYGRTAKERTDRSAKRKHASAAKKTLADLTGENVDRRSYGSWLTQITTGAQDRWDRTAVHRRAPAPRPDGGDPGGRLAVARRAGESVATVAPRLGYSSPAVTLGCSGCRATGRPVGNPRILAGADRARFRRLFGTPWSVDFQRVRPYSLAKCLQK